MRIQFLSVALATSFCTSVAVRAQDPGPAAVVLDTLHVQHDPPSFHLDLLIGRNETAESIRRLLMEHAAQLAPDDSTQQVDLFMTEVAFQAHHGTHPAQIRLRRADIQRLNEAGYAASLQWFKRYAARPRIVWHERFEGLPAEIIE